MSRLPFQVFGPGSPFEDVSPRSASVSPAAAAAACPGELGSGSPLKDTRQRQNLQRFPVKTLDRVNHYEREAL